MIIRTTTSAFYYPVSTSQATNLIRGDKESSICSRFSFAVHAKEPRNNLLSKLRPATPKLDVLQPYRARPT